MDTRTKRLSEQVTALGYLHALYLHIYLRFVIWSRMKTHQKDEICSTNRKAFAIVRYPLHTYPETGTDSM